MRESRLPARLISALVLVLVVCGLDAAWRPGAPAPAQALLPQARAGAQAVDGSGLQRVDGGRVPMPEGARAAHASSLLVMPADSPAALTLFWFSGERESGPQVQIVASQWLRASGAWSAPQVVANRHRLGASLGHGLRRLGNPVAWSDAQGRMHLFVVATGWGGWAASRILHLRQSSASQEMGSLAFEPLGVLPLSWLWNTSFMVRNAPMPLADGGMVLPVHFELGSKIPAALRFGPDGSFRGVTRLSRHDYWLQPALVALSPTHWLAYFRDERDNGRVGWVQSLDAGRSWTDQPDLDLPNPDAAVAALALGPGQLLLAHNPVRSGRGRLDLSRSADGRHWSLVQTLEAGAPDAEFSYPALAWADGQLWLSYTVEREYLAWQRLAPPAAQPQEPGNPSAMVSTSGATP